MTDSKILDKVYELMTESSFTPPSTRLSSIQNFIEQEWQRRDEEVMEQEAKAPYADTKFSKTLPPDIGGEYPHALTSDVQEIERHRGLEIGPDGTVKELK